MKIGDIIKKQTTVIAVAVVLVMVVAIGVSYAIFFDVKAGDQQIVTAGTLNVAINNLSAITLTEPKSNTDGLQMDAIQYTPSNGGNLPATYSIYIFASDAVGLDINNIKYSTDGLTTKELTGLETTTVSGAQVASHNGLTAYKIDGGTLAANNGTDTKNLRVWIDEDTLANDFEQGTINLYLYIVSEVNENN